MKNGITKFTGLLFGLMFVLLLLPQTAATVEWEDNFDDGTYAPEWTVEEGAWDATNGYLEVVLDGPITHIIYRNSSQVTGTWSFDIFFVDNPSNAGHIRIDFIVNGSDSYYMGLNQRGDGGDPELTLKGGVSLNISYFVIGSGTWTEFDITRNSAGETHIFVNKTGPVAEPTLSIIDTTFSYSEQFGITIGGDAKGSRVDNIVVKDTIDIIPPEPNTPTTTDTTLTTTDGGDDTPMDTTLLIIGAGVAGVVLIVAVVFLRKR